jgi:hypothetical protein
VGIYLVAIGFLGVAGLLTTGFLVATDEIFPPRDRSVSVVELVLSAGGTLFFLAAGVGILASRRWGWGLALVACLFLFALGLLTMFGPADIAYPGAQPISLVLLVIPALIGLAGLLAPATQRWMVRRRRGVDRVA